MRHIINSLRCFRLVAVFLWALLPITSIGKTWLHRTLILMGPTFIKAGQFLSSRPDVVGQRISDDLKMLHDKLPAFSSKKTKAILLNDFGTAQLFRHIEDTPVSAASVAQVYKAIDFDGSLLAVKVLRPNIEKAMLANLDFLRWLTSIACIIIPSIRALKPHSIIDFMLKEMQQEVDMRMEAARIAEFSENNKNTNIVVPKVYWDRTSKNVLTMEWIVRAPCLDYNNAALIVAHGFFKNACEHGFFHADMHSGNIINTTNNKIALVDFGKIGRLSIEERYYISSIFKYFLSKDYKKLAQLHLDLQYIKKEFFFEFSSACRAISESFLHKTMGQVSATKLLSYMFDVARRFGMQSQPQLMLFHKNLLMIEGLFSEYIELNIWHVAQEWLHHKPEYPGIRHYIITLRKYRNLNRTIDNIERILQPQKDKSMYILALTCLCSAAVASIITVMIIVITL